MRVPLVKVRETAVGLHEYGEVLFDRDGVGLAIFESRDARGPHAWIHLDETQSGKRSPQGKMSFHASVPLAIALIRALQTFVDEAPERWAAPKVQYATRRRRSAAELKDKP